MQQQSRFIKSIIAASKEQQPPMPWFRGNSRAAFVQKRRPAEPQLKRA